MSPGTLPLLELYASIQGESTQAGRPCTFVRLAGCDLRCSWCDSRWTWTARGEPVPLPELLERVDALGLELVEVTGGEPLLHAATPALLRGLLERGHEVLLETNGAHDIRPVPREVRVILDLKAPSSGETHRMRWDNLDALPPHGELKLVLADRRDYDWARRVLREHRLDRWTVLLSPVLERLEPRRLAAWMLEDRLPARLQLQLHKFIWEPGARGV